MRNLLKEIQEEAKAIQHATILPELHMWVSFYEDILKDTEGILEVPPLLRLGYLVNDAKITIVKTGLKSITTLEVALANENKVIVINRKPDAPHVYLPTSREIYEFDGSVIRDVSASAKVYDIDRSLLNRLNFGVLSTKNTKEIERLSKEEPKKLIHMFAYWPYLLESRFQFDKGYSTLREVMDLKAKAMEE